MATTAIHSFGVFVVQYFLVGLKMGLMFIAAGGSNPGVHAMFTRTVSF